MDSVGIKQLNRDTSAVMRRVRDHQETLEVTYRGKVVAHIVPVPSSNEIPIRNWEDVWEDMNRLSVRTTERWPEGMSAVDAVREQRRELASASLESLAAHIRKNGAKRREEARAHFDKTRGAFTDEKWQNEAKMINAEGDKIAAEIGSRSTGPVSSVALVREGRRDFGHVRD